MHTITPGRTQVLQSQKKLAKLQKSDTLILDSNLHAVKIYHVLQPSPAGNLWPTLYTLLPLRHTGGTFGLTATLHTWPQPLEQHF